MSLDKKNSINNILEEKRIFPPSKKFAENSNISSKEALIWLPDSEYKRALMALPEFVLSRIY